MANGQDIGATIILMVYYLVGVVLIPTVCKAWLKLPGEIIRKTQHIVYSLSIFILLEFFSAWYKALGAAFLLILIAYPLLPFLEKTNLYQKYFVDRTKQGGELRRQLLYVQFSFALLIIVFWGFLGAEWRYIAAVAVMAWGFGDATAAIVGKAWGRNVITHHWVKGGKTREGTGAMMLTAGGVIWGTLLLYNHFPWSVCLFIAVVAAPVCGVVELFSPRGTDTLTVPWAAAAIIFPLSYFFTYWG